jgi:hypothetical protein
VRKIELLEEMTSKLVLPGEEAKLRHILESTLLSLPPWRGYFVFQRLHMPRLELQLMPDVID